MIGLKILAPAVGVALIAAFLFGRSTGFDACEARAAKARDAAMRDAANDEERQAETARSDDDLLRAEIARLTRLMNERDMAHADDRTCILRDDAERLRDDYADIFARRLQAGAGPDDGE